MLSLLFNFSGDQNSVDALVQEIAVKVDEKLKISGEFYVILCNMVVSIVDQVNSFLRFIVLPRQRNISENPAGARAQVSNSAQVKHEDAVEQIEQNKSVESLGGNQGNLQVSHC